MVAEWIVLGCLVITVIPPMLFALLGNLLVEDKRPDSLDWDDVP